MDDKQVLRGFMANFDVLPPLILTFQFNPESVSDNKTVKYEDTQGDLCTAPGKTYTGGGDRTITFDLKLHGMEQGTNKVLPTGLDNGISTELAKLRSFLYPLEDPFAALADLFGDASQGKRLTDLATAPPVRALLSAAGKGGTLQYTEPDGPWLAAYARVTGMGWGVVVEAPLAAILAPVRADVKVTLAVIEDGTLYKFDKAHRTIQAALGLANVSPF